MAVARGGGGGDSSLSSRVSLKLASYVGLGPEYYRRPRPTRVGPISVHLGPT